MSDTKKQMTREEFDAYFGDVEIVDETDTTPEKVDDEPLKLVDDDATVTVQYGGVDITIDTKMLGDMRVLYLMAKVNKRSVPTVDKIGYYNDLLDLLVGGDLYEVYTAIANENGGHMDAEEMGDFIKVILEAAGGKN